MQLRVIASILALTVSLDLSQVSAFAISQKHSGLQQKLTTVPTLNRNLMANRQDSLPRGGAATTTTKTAMSATKDAAAGPAPPKKRVRITALDGIRSLLCIHIVLGHFLRFAGPSEFWLKFFAQINITVGAFFALSGYVTAYTSTEVGQRAASPKLTGTPSQKWWLTKVMAYYPMHWLVLLLFSPMFVYSDVTMKGWPTAILHGIMSATLTQAWAPMHAEVWNAPTWFLSSMTFSTAILPFSLPKIAQMDKRALRRAAVWLGLINLLPVLGYCYDHNLWGLVEGLTPPKKHPALAIFNVQRFHPVFNVAEILMGAVACRLAMLDGTDDEKDKPVKSNWMSTALPFAGLVAILTSRAAGLVPDCSDLLVRSVLFTPLFLKFVVGAHRNTIAGDSIKDPVLNLLSSKPLVWLGGLTFPIYIVHGPIGQVFYKRLIAGKLWGGVLNGPGYFALYLASVFVSAILLQNLFLKNKAVGTWSKNRAEAMASWMKRKTKQ